MNRQDDIRHILNQVENINEAISGGNARDNIGRSAIRAIDDMVGTVEDIGPQTVGGIPDGTDATADALGTSRYYIIKWEDGTKEAVNRYATTSSIDLKKPIVVYDEDVSGWASPKWKGASMSLALSETKIDESMKSDSLTMEVCLDIEADTWVEAEVHYEASPAEPADYNYPGAEGTIGIYDIVYNGKSIIDSIDEPLNDVETRLKEELNNEAENQEGERADWEYEQHRDRMYESKLTEAEEQFALEVDGEVYEPEQDDDLYYDWQSVSGIPEDMITFAQTNFDKEELEWQVYDIQTGEVQGDNDGEGALLDSSRAMANASGAKVKADDAKRAEYERVHQFKNMTDEEILAMLAQEAANKDLGYNDAVDHILNRTADTGLYFHADDEEKALAAVGIVEPIIDPEIEHRLISEITMQIGLWGSGMEEDYIDGLNRIYKKYNIGSAGLYDDSKGMQWWQNGGEEKVIKAAGGDPKTQSFDDLLADAYEDIKADMTGGDREYPGPQENPWRMESMDRLMHLSGQETLKESDISNSSDEKLLKWLERNDTDEPNIGDVFANQIKRVRNEVRRRGLKYTDPALRSESIIKTFEAKRK